MNKENKKLVTIFVVVFVISLSAIASFAYTIEYDSASHLENVTTIVTLYDDLEYPVSEMFERSKEKCLFMTKTYYEIYLVDIVINNTEGNIQTKETVKEDGMRELWIKSKNGEEIEVNIFAVAEVTEYNLRRWCK